MRGTSDGAAVVNAWSVDATGESAWNEEHDLPTVAVDTGTERAETLVRTLYDDATEQS